MSGPLCLYTCKRLLRAKVTSVSVSGEYLSGFSEWDSAWYMLLLPVLTDPLARLLPNEAHRGAGQEIQKVAPKKVR